MFRRVFAITSTDIDNGGVLKDFTGVLIRDGYAGYDHLPAVHAWCGAHLIRAVLAVALAVFYAIAVDVRRR